MATLAAIRTAIQTTLETAITAALVKVYPTVENVTVIPEGGAAVVVLPTAADFAVAMGKGLDRYDFDLLVMVNPADATIAQTTLDGFVTGGGSSSIRSAVFATPGLGLTSTNAWISGVSGYGARFESAGIPHIGAVLALHVHTPGTS